MTTSATLQVLWGLPVLASTLGVFYLVIRWLQQQHVPGVVFAALLGGLAALSFSLSAKVALRGIVYRSWSR